MTPKAKAEAEAPTAPTADYGTPNLDLAHRFAYHPPSSDSVARTHESVRDAFGGLAQWADQTLPEGREKSLVVTKLEEAMMWANAAIARNQD